MLHISEIRVIRLYASMNLLVKIFRLFFSELLKRRRIYKTKTPRSREFSSFSFCFSFAIIFDTFAHSHKKELSIKYADHRKKNG